ncbi:uracil-DNA glycosylase [bacterium]|nr:MAG: uracil-DNA glycosylase [bacterium]
MPVENPAWEALNAEIIACRKCPRLVAWREEVARVKRRAFRDWEYWGRPVPAFGDPNARLLVIGLAPGAHGSNRTGRMFTGDASGEFLYAALHRAGFASHPRSLSREDDLVLRDVMISAACRCAPPDNKPTQQEMDNCRPFLQAEVTLMPQIQGIIALGSIGFQTALTVYRQRGASIPALKFGHGAIYELGQGLPWLLASYHPSQQNTQTGRLTVAMFDQIWQTALEKLN